MSTGECLWPTLTVQFCQESDFSGLVPKRWGRCDCWFVRSLLASSLCFFCYFLVPPQMLALRPFLYAREKGLWSFTAHFRATTYSVRFMVFLRFCLISATEWGENRPSPTPGRAPNLMIYHRGANSKTPQHCQGLFLIENRLELGFWFIQQSEEFHRDTSKFYNPGAARIRI